MLCFNIKCMQMRTNIFYVVRNDNTATMMLVTAPPNSANQQCSVYEYEVYANYKTIIFCF